MNKVNSQEKFISRIRDKVTTTRSSLVGEKFNIISMMGEVKYEVEVAKLIGAGGSSLVYQVYVDDTYPPIKNMIMKEFYPNYNEDIVKASRNPLNRLELNFDPVDREAEDRLRKDRDKFMDAYNKHIRILDMDRYLEGRIVRPYRIEIDNSYLYSLYEVDTATSVDKYYNLDLARIVDILIQTADILIHLHNNGVIYMDLKPANILYDYNNNKVKLFDFDAAIDLRELEYTNEFYMPSEKAFIPPELRYITDISNRKELFISEEVDLYMLGVTFFYLLLRRYPIDLENEDMDYLARNVREVLNHKSNKILINNKAADDIVELLQQTLSMHRFISVADFKNKLIEIENNLRFKNDEEFSNIISAAYFLDYNRLYNYIIEDEGSKHIDVAIVGDNNLTRTFFSFVFGVVDLEGVDLNITFYDKNPKKFYNSLLADNPLLAETTEISLNGRVRDRNINTDITDKAYAHIDFKTTGDEIDQPFIVIVDETGYDYTGLGDSLYEKLKDDGKDRIILNYARNNHAVDVKEGGSTTYFNLDLSSTPTFRNRDYNDKILDQAFEFYRLNIMNHYGERMDPDSIWSGFLRPDFYNLKASLRAILSIRYKVYMAGIADQGDVAGEFYDKVIKMAEVTEGISMRDILADYEHRSWNRFMISQGFKVPTMEELYSYACVDLRYYVDYQNKYHPFITNSDIRVAKNGELDKLEITIREVDEIVRQKTIHNEQQARYRLMNILNNTHWEDNKYLIELRPLWEDLVILANKIIENEFYANNSLNVLTYQIDEVLERAKPELRVIAADYEQVKEDLYLIVQRNRHTAFRESEYLTVDSIPLISSERVKTIYKPFIADDEDLWANIIATIKFYPENLIFLTDEPIDENRIYRITSFLNDKRLQSSLKIEVITYRQMKYYSKENAIVDFTRNSHAEAMRPELAGIPYVEYGGFNNWSGNYVALDYYISQRSLTVEETFFLNNAQIYDNKSISNTARLMNYYEQMWETYLGVDSEDWDRFVDAIDKNADYYELCLDGYEKTAESSLIEVGDFIFRKHDAGKYRSLGALLEELVAEGLIYAYEFPVNPGKLKIHSYNDELSKDLGDFISVNMWQYNGGFELVKTQLAERDYADTYCILADKQAFSYDYEVEDPVAFADKTNAIMTSIDSKNEGEISRVFNHLYQPTFVEVIDEEKTVRLSYELGDRAFREFFANKGNILRSYTYFELIKCADLFDEIKLNVNLRWKAYDDYSEDSLPIENILDIVCTKGFSTFIISTIKKKIEYEDLYEINNHTSQFGIDARPILIASNSNDDTSNIKKVAAAAGVYFIDRQMIIENGLVEYITNIASGKKDWQNVNGSL